MTMEIHATFTIIFVAHLKNDNAYGNTRIICYTPSAICRLCVTLTGEGIGARVDTCQSFRCSEVRYLENATVRVHKDIVPLDVTMDDLVVMLKAIQQRNHQSQRRNQLHNAPLNDLQLLKLFCGICLHKLSIIYRGYPVKFSK